MRAQLVGSLSFGLASAICSRTVTDWPFWTWVRTSPAKAGWERTRSDSSFTVAKTGGSSTRSLASGPVTLRETAGGPAPRSESCAKTEAVASQASPPQSQEFDFIRIEVKI